MKRFLPVTLVLMLSACGGNDINMSDEELADAVHACRSSVDQSPGFAIRCDNFKRECSKRREEGRFVC